MSEITTGARRSLNGRQSTGSGEGVWPSREGNPGITGHRLPASPQELKRSVVLIQGPGCWAVRSGSRAQEGPEGQIAHP